MSEEVVFRMSCKRTSLHPVPSFEHRRLVCAKVLSVDWRICLAMPPQSKRVHETESSSGASAPKRIRGSAANKGRAGFEADPIALWRAATITKYDLMMIEFDRDARNWAIMQRSKHYSVSRMVLRDQTTECEVHAHRDRSTQCVHTRDHQHLS